MFNSTDSPPSSNERPARSGLAFGVSSPRLGLLDAGLTELEAAEQLARSAEAARIAALAKIDLAARLEAAFELSTKARQRAAEDSLAYRAARAEAATALHQSEQATADQLTRAATLTAGYRATLAVLEAGDISQRHAAVILDAGSVIGPVVLPGDHAAGAVVSGPDVVAEVAEAATNRAMYEALVLAEAVKTTPNRLRPIALSIAERFALEDLDTRYERARTSRRVWITMRDEGLAEIGALLPAHEAIAVASRLTEIAKRVKLVEAREAAEAREATAARTTAGEAGSEREPVALPPRRTLPEIKADLFADLLLNGTGETATGGPGTGVGISGLVQLITHEAHFSDDSGTDRIPLPELEGYGPIPVSMAQEIAAGDGVWNQVNVSLRTGEVLTVDRYRPSEQMRRFLAARDQRCRFPGCRVPVFRCDFDHTVDAALGGPTSTTNLGALCRGHHMLKHHSGWDTQQHADGDYEWTSPTGRSHVDEPVSRVRFLPIPEPTQEPARASARESARESWREPRPEGTAPPKTEHQGTAPSSGGGSEDTHPF